MPPGRRYLDASSVEPMHAAAREALLGALDQGWADPRRLHREGQAARRVLDNARAVVAEALGVAAEEVRFTGSGTEATQLGVLGLVHARPRGGLVAHPAVEHAAVRHAAVWAADRWGERDADPLVTPVDHTGRADVEALGAAARRPGVAAVALQSANHEVGTRQPVDALDLPDDVPLFVDAGVSAGRLPLPRRWTTVAATASQWGGPADVGVLLVRRGSRWLPPFPGDDEPGTDGLDRVPSALAAAAALQSLVAEADVLAARQRAWIDRVRAAAAAVPETDVVGDPVDRVPHLVTFSCLYAPGDELVRAFDRRGFAVASGSACTASSLEPSHVLAAMGALTHGNVRVGLTRSTTDDDVAAFCAAVPDAVAEARAVVGR